jgi:hypothetical protein
MAAEIDPRGAVQSVPVFRKYYLPNGGSSASRPGGRC